VHVHTRSVELAAPPTPLSASTLSTKVPLRRLREFDVCRQPQAPSVSKHYTGYNRDVTGMVATTQ